MNFVDIVSPARPTKPPRRKVREEPMNFVGIVSPARPTKPPRRKDRERGDDDINKPCDSCKTYKTIKKREREREKKRESIIFISLAAPARPIKPPRRERERES